MSCHLQAAAAGGGLLLLQEEGGLASRHAAPPGLHHPLGEVQDPRFLREGRDAPKGHRPGPAPDSEAARDAQARPGGAPRRSALSSP